MIKIIIQKNVVRFSFDKYVNLMLSVIPKPDLLGISEIRFVNNFINPVSDSNALAHYLQRNNGKNAVIEVHVTNLLKQKISEFYYEKHPEIAALYLSGIIFHEIGHHVHQFKRHGVKKRKIEKFAENYSTVGYFNYLKIRETKILRSYTWGILNFIWWNKKEREMFKISKQELIDWLNDNKNGMQYP